MQALEHNHSLGELPAGTRIDGRYTVHGLLGRGAQAIVYEGTHDELARPVAIKVLDMSWAGESSAITRFLREARTASALSHSHIVDVSDLGRLHDGRPYLVMPRVPGQPLSAWLWTHGKQSVQRVAQLLTGVASALDLIHARGFVHRDIKPDNLMFVQQADGSETVVLLDFGIAILTSASAPRVTQRNVLFGTPAYMPPELWEGGVSDARGDIYALATVAFELITGLLPFDDDNALQLLAKKYRTPAPRLSDMAPGEFSLALEAVFRRALMRQPELRFETAGAFVSAVRRAAEGGAVSADAADVTESTHRLTLRTDARRAPRQTLLRPGRRAQWRAVFGRTRLASQLVKGVLRRRARAHVPGEVVSRDAESSRTALALGWRAGIPLIALALVLLLPQRIDTTSVGPMPPMPPIPRAEPAHSVSPERSGQPRHDAAPRDVRVNAEQRPPAGPALTNGGVSHEPSPQAVRAVPVISGPGEGTPRLPAHVSAATSAKHVETPSRVDSHSASASQQRTKSANYDPSVVQQQVANATTLLLRGDTERAIQGFQAALAMNPESAPAWRGLGIAYEREHEEVKALAAYRHYLGLATQDPQREAVRKRIRMLE